MEKLCCVHCGKELLYNGVCWECSKKARKAIKHLQLVKENLYRADIQKVLLELREKILQASDKKETLLVVDSFIEKFKSCSEDFEEIEKVKEPSEFFKNIFDSEDFKCTKQDFLDFQDTGACRLCGTQRCYGAEEDYLFHAKYCGEFKKFLREKGGN